MDVLRKERLFLKMPKCELGKNYLVYLGHMIGGGELNIDPSKVSVIVNWPIPKSVTKVRLFLGVAQYRRKFIANLSSIEAPLHGLTNMKVVFQWGGKSKKHLIL